MRLLKLGMTLALFVIMSNSINGQNVVLDNYYNNEIDKNFNKYHYIWSDKSLSGFSKLGDVFKSNGGQISSFFKKPNAKSLKKADIYIIVDPDNYAESMNPKFMDKKTASIIADWVYKGGKLLLLTNDYKNCDLDSINLLAEKFGIKFLKKMNNEERVTNTNVRDFESCAVTRLPKHDLFNNISKMFIKSTSSIECKDGAVPVLKKTGEVLMAESIYGKGYVLAVGDPWLYNEYIDNEILPKDFDNFTAAKNLVNLLINK